MAGHSQFKNIMHRKGAKDAKRAKIFAKLAREIIVAARSGPDPSGNPRLRAAIQAGRAENMPKDKIDAAIKKGSGVGDTDNYDEMRYEGYGPGGVAVIVETLTDNRNRTAADVRAIFSKYSGNMGETGSVGFMFDRVGLIEYPAKVGSEEAVFEAAVEAGAENCESDSEQHRVTCQPDSLHEVAKGLEAKFGEPSAAKLTWIPKNTSPIGEEQAQTLLKLIDALEDHDDVQQVITNFEVSDEVMQRLSA